MLLLNPAYQSIAEYMRLFSSNLWDFFLFFWYGCICGGVLIYWMQTYRISKGHNISGMTATTLTWMYLPVIFTANGHWLVTLSFLPMIGLSALLGYSAIYLYNWPLYEQWLDDKEDGKVADRPPVGYWTNSRLGRYALQTQAENTSWLVRHYRPLLGAVAFVATLFFGFYRSVENFTAGVASASQQTKQEVKAVVKTELGQAKQDIKKDIATSTASVTAIQTGIAEDVAIAQQQVDTLKGRVAGTEKKSDEATRRSKRADAKADRAMQSPSLYVYPMHPRVPNGNANERLDVPPKLRGRKTGMVLDADSLERIQMARYNVDDYSDANQ
ncbi:hypothetical protein CLV58_12572 [Spirosoma oryzae]|uniref:Uncharacterized protein n=1 Tax=Spirosoma oryzae TaxID=1469603 RepID=A0A2T0S8Q8_9BACT|nr:DUF1542 domain-containing protein [Spirosoma oryzae]PRY29810.1 hypothetical protein CLV58_12572 [Spirosoma oryzae]